MFTARGLHEVLTPAVLELVQVGSDRPVLGVELVEAGEPIAVHHGNLVLMVGQRVRHEVLDLLGMVGDAAGVVLRRPWAEDAEVRRRCAELELPLLTFSEEVTWSRVLSTVRTALDQAAAAGLGLRSVDQVYGDLFEIADQLGTLLGAPITIEDATSRVLAYSTGQVDVDEARLLTIVGRQVPREVRRHFRSLGVFRRLATSDEAFFVPAGEGGVRARFVVPVRAAGEWLGSIWAVVDAPVAADRSRQLASTTQTLALLMLRLRSQGELQRHIELDRVRTLLRGRMADRPAWLEDGPWRVAILAGPDHHLTPEARCELWTTLTRRHGWRHPLIADVDGAVYSLLRDEGTVPGTWAWLATVVHHECRGDATISTVAGRPVGTLDGLALSRDEADELGGLPPDRLSRPVACMETAWADVVIARAVVGVSRSSSVLPISGLSADQDREGQLLSTLEAAIDHWGQPQRAAQALGVHPNTVRYRMNQIVDSCSADLDDPAHRLALKLELAARRARND